MRVFFVTARTAKGPEYFSLPAASSAEAEEQIRNLFNEPCGITVVPGVR
ncbi:hypothetical protein [Massilia aerilata]|uniref:Uncharacterized protein n=1 Tax=Massilia aerilata TaxID=453817 RepID=A0ABW0RUP1_9BURK